MISTKVFALEGYLHVTICDWFKENLEILMQVSR